MDIEQNVVSHYTHGSLEAAILEALSRSGKDLERLQPDDLSGADEFHTGWRPATLKLAEALGLSSGHRLLDIGSGLGGPARTFAQLSGCCVDGIDLTPEYVDVARSLTRRCGLAERVSFQVASALSMPGPDGVYDRATLIHVGMNIADKARVFRQAARVLKPGGLIGVYDLMITGPGDIPYPMPWAQTREASFLETPQAYRSMLEEAGFSVQSEQNLREFCLELAGKMKAAASVAGPSPLALHILLGPASPQRFANVLRTIERGVIGPVLMIARKG